MERARRRTELLYELVARVNQAADLEQIYGAALDAIAAALETPRAAVLLFDDAGVMQFVAARGLSDAYRAAVTGHSPWGPDAQAPEPIFVPDVRGAPGLAQFRELFVAERIGALGFFPLVASGRLAGKFMVYYETPRELAAEDREMAAAIANHVAAGVARLSAARARDRLVEQLELFQAMLGHDLRNPLFAMLTGTQLAMLRASDEAVRKPLQRVLASGDRMTRMIDQLLDVTRVRAGRGLVVQRRPADLAAIARDAIDELAHAGAVSLRQTGDVTGCWDPDRLAQVLSNLISNALQHGTGAEVMVSIADRGDAVRIEVANPGTIPAAVLDRLFEPFSDSQHDREGRRGMGLGLFITRQVVEAHGGTIAAVSQAGRTAFTIDLPRA